MCDPAVILIERVHQSFKCNTRSDIEHPFPGCRLTNLSFPLPLSFSLSPSLSTRIDPRKIFGAKCDLTLRSFYLYRCSPAGTLPNIPTLTADDACDDDERPRHTPRRHRAWYTVVVVPTSPSRRTFFNNFLNKRPTLPRVGATSCGP